MRALRRMATTFLLMGGFRNRNYGGARSAEAEGR
jgi:hypothetical protein